MILPFLIFFISYTRSYADVVVDPVEPSDTYDSFIPKLLLFCLICIIGLVHLLAKGLMLNKRAGRGWRILIPFYGRYLEYKTYWKARYFWINFGLSLYLLLITVGVPLLDNDTVTTIIGLQMLIVSAAYTVIIIGLRMNIMAVFGFSKWLGLLELLFLGFILDCICGFSGRGKIEQTPEETPSQPVPEDPDPIENWD